MKVFLLIYLILNVSAQNIQWQAGNWAMNCDFRGNDFANVRSSGEDCGGICARTSGCSHFTWSNHLGGTCWLKNGQVTKNNAFFNQNTVCGLNIDVIVTVAPVTPTTVTSGPVTAGPVTPGPVTDNANKWPNCQFKAGRSYDQPTTDYSNFDYITIWINTISDAYGTDFNPWYQGLMIDECKKQNKLPVFYAYLIAFEARHKYGFNDCDVDPNNNLCIKGAQFIKNYRQVLVDRYGYQAQKIAERLGKDRPCLFLMEPDFWQYYGDHQQQGGTLSGEYIRDLFNDFVKQIKTHLPNAMISWDISAWIGEAGFRTFWGYFANSQIDFVHTSGGQGRADLSQYKPNELQWSFISQATGKKIIADCGYGVAGGPSDNCATWFNGNNLNNRVSDGVIALSQANGFTKVNKPTLPCDNTGVTVAPVTPTTVTSGPVTTGPVTPGPVIVDNIFGNWAAGINGQGDWAFDCDFKANDLSNVKSSGEDCSCHCKKTQGCSHFVFTNHNGGTCWMKSGKISKSDALYEAGAVCGVVQPHDKTECELIGNGGNGGKWVNCQFKSGASFDGGGDLSKFDYLTLWIGFDSEGYGTDFNPNIQGPMIDYCKQNNKTPLFYSYHIAFEGRAKFGFQDCDVNPHYNLCVKGAQFIRENRQYLVSRYGHWASKIAERLGKDRTAIFLIEPDFWQYYGDHQQQGGTLSGEYMRDLFNDFAKQIKTHLPNALISWDISGWIGYGGFSHWWSFFQNSPIDFVHTSGGQSHGENSQLRPGQIEWSFISKATGKNIIADCGYGVAGHASANCGPWYDSNHLNNRIRDGVVALSQAHTFFPFAKPKVC